jgi:hypothetical protein
MKFTKKEIAEIVDADGELIGNDAVPTHGSDMGNRSTNTTDQNAKIGHQPFDYNTITKFGFFMYPFYEGKEVDEKKKNDLIYDLYKIIYEQYVDILKYYYKNPNKLKSDYRKISEETIDLQKEKNVKTVENLLKVVDIFFDKSSKESETIDESNVLEDKMIEKKSEDEISKKSEDNGIKDKKIQKIAGLISKLEKKDINALLNLLERK